MTEPASTPLVSVVMPCFDDLRLVEKALPRLVGSSRCDLELLLVNNDSRQSNGMRELVESLGDPRLRILELEHGAGFSEAVNAGIAATTGEFVFLANSDLFVSDGYVDTLVAFLAAHPEAACASGKLLRYDLEADCETDIIDSTGHVIGRNRRVADRGENERDTGQFDEEQEVFGVSGAAVVARRAALESTRVRGEYLDESFGMYKEDVDLCWRLRLAGWQCWYVPAARAHHARTSRGLARNSYLSSIRAFHANEKRKPRHVRMHSLKNQWLLLLKNDHLRNTALDLPRILGRELLVVAHSVLVAPRDTAVAIGWFVRALPSTLAKRRFIVAGRRVTAPEIRYWFDANYRGRSSTSAEDTRSIVSLDRPPI